MDQKTLYLLVDYREFFMHKRTGKFYRGGMDLEELRKAFEAFGYRVLIKPFAGIAEEKIDPENSIVLYTSAEDKGGHYKRYIEDLVFHLEQKNVPVFLPFKYLHVHDNKVAMELLRSRINDESIKTIRSRYFGSIEELRSSLASLEFPVVMKTSSGAKGRGVSKADTPAELIKTAKKIMRTRYLRYDLKQISRSLRYGEKWRRQSFYRNKIVVQNLIPGLNDDWKVLVFGKKIFTINRANRENDFRASGSGKFEFRTELPPGMLDFAYKVRELFDVPNCSIDIGYDGKDFHLIEFQFLYFGTGSIEWSPYYFLLEDEGWKLVDEKTVLEQVYAESIHLHLQAHGK